MSSGSSFEFPIDQTATALPNANAFAALIKAHTPSGSWLHLENRVNASELRLEAMEPEYTRAIDSVRVNGGPVEVYKVFAGLSNPQHYFAGLDSEVGLIAGLPLPAEH